MTGVTVDETVDAGAETHIGCWDIDLLDSLFGSSVELSEFVDEPLDYDAAIQEQSLETVLAD